MQVLKIVQIITALLLITVILLQNRGSGLSGIFGGDSNVYLAKRGMEKNLFIATIILAILFILVSLASIIL
ncbi:MAG: preprotein translocase subunit SecG [Patescibacteria group bacterium]